MSLDRISTLPEPILETILCLLPSVEAARTSILSREWRYKWTRIPKLNFSVGEETTYELTSSDIASATENMNMHDVHQVLLRRQAPIHELTLSMTGDYDLFEFGQIILLLSMSDTVKKLTLFGSHDDWWSLPIAVFSLHHLTHLYISDFELEYLSEYDLDRPSIFENFGSLESLDLSDVMICTKTLLQLLLNCPSLKSLNLHIHETYEDDTDDIVESDGQCTANELFKCLPVIEHLTMTARGGADFQWLVLDSVLQELPPPPLLHLKSLCLVGQAFVEDCELDFVLVMIRCSPNLERIELLMVWDLSGYMEDPFVKEYCRDVWLENLKELVMYFSHSSQMEFLNFILARSPKLKKLTLRVFSTVDQEQESNVLKTLERAPRASPGVTIAISRLSSEHLYRFLFSG